MATKKPKPNGAAHDDAVLAALKAIHEEMQAQGVRAESRLDEVTSRVERRLDEVTSEMRAIRSILVDAAMKDRNRLDDIERRLETLEAGKH
ncbi:MAG: hypothetical protein Q8O67_06215 [Deltaproteobacteria bacterium]|nr:hypothetical protein [Deltaproteobacteria bacterium]